MHLGPCSLLLDELLQKCSGMSCWAGTGRGLSSGRQHSSPKAACLQPHRKVNSCTRRTLSLTYIHTHIHTNIHASIYTTMFTLSKCLHRDFGRLLTKLAFGSLRRRELGVTTLCHTHTHISPVTYTDKSSNSSAEERGTSPARARARAHTRTQPKYHSNGGVTRHREHNITARCGLGGQCSLHDASGGLIELRMRSIQS